MRWGSVEVVPENYALRSTALVNGFHFAAHLLRCCQDPQRIFAQDFSDVGRGVALFEKSVGDLGK
jgi:hypothetical protein